MACRGSGPIETYTGDNTVIEVEFWEDEDQTVAHLFEAGATVTWHMIDKDGVSAGTFPGAVDAITLNRLTGTITGGAPPEGTYSLYARVVTGDAPNTVRQTVPTPSHPLELQVTGDPIPA